MFRRLLPALAVATTVTAAPAHALTAEQAMAFVNAQRAASGIPADLVVDHVRSEACAKHLQYEQVNEEAQPGPDHGEDPDRPGYTPEGHAVVRVDVGKRSRTLSFSRQYRRFALPRKRHGRHRLQLRLVAADGTLSGPVHRRVR